MAKIGRLVKDLAVQELAAALKERPNFFITGVAGLPVVEADTLRKRLRGAQATVMMVKRRLGLRGVSSMEHADGLKEFFTGSVAFVFPGEDIIPAAKLLVEFAKSSQDKLTVRGGLVEGQVLDKKRIEQLASLPSKPQLIAEVIGAIESPIVDLIFTVERVLGDVAWVLEEAAKTRPQAADSAPTTAQSPA